MPQGTPTPRQYVPSPDQPVLDFQYYIAQRSGTPPAPLPIKTTTATSCPAGPFQCCRSVDSTTAEMFQLMGIDGYVYVTSTMPIRQMDSPYIIYVANTIVGEAVWTIRYRIDGETNMISSMEVFTAACPLPPSGQSYIYCANCPSDRTLQAVTLAARLQSAASACNFNSPLVNELGVSIHTRIAEQCNNQPDQCCNSDDAYNHAFYIDLLCIQQGNATTPAFISATNNGNTVYAGSTVITLGGTYTIVYTMNMNFNTGLYEITLINIGSQVCPINDTYIDCGQCVVLDPLQDLIKLDNAIWTCDPYSLLVENLDIIPSTMNAPCYGSTDYCCATISSSSSEIFTLACTDTLDRSFDTPVLISGVVGDIDLVYRVTMSVTTVDGPADYKIEYSLLKVGNAYQITNILIYQSVCTAPVDYNTCAPNCPEPAIYAATYFQDYIARTGIAPQVLTIGTINSETCASPPNDCCKTSNLDTAYIYTLLGLNGNVLVSSTPPVLESFAFGDPVLTLTATTTVDGAAWNTRYLMMIGPDGFTYFIDAIQFWQDTCPLPLDGSDGFIDCATCPVKKLLQ